MGGRVIFGSKGKQTFKINKARKWRVQGLRDLPLGWCLMAGTRGVEFTVSRLCFELELV